MANAEPVPTGQPTGQATGSQQKAATKKAPHPPAPDPPQLWYRRAAMYQALVRDGLHARAASERLHLDWRTTRRTIGFLLKMGTIRGVGAPPMGSGAIRFFEAGSIPFEEVGRVGRVTAGGTGPPAPLAAHLHRGRRSVPITSPARNPKDPAVGWKKSWVASTVTNHLYEWTDQDGNPWKFQAVMATRKQPTLMVFPPPVVTRDPEQVRTVNDGWWNDRAMKAAHTWATLADYALARARESIKESQPVEAALLGTRVPPFGVPGQDPVWSDRSPEPSGNLETNRPDLGASFMAVPGQVVSLQAQMVEVRREMAGVLAVVAEGVAMSAQMRDGLAGTVRMVTNVAQTVAGLAVPAVAASSPYSQPFTPGVEYA